MWDRAIEVNPSRVWFFYQIRILKPFHTVQNAAIGNKSIVYALIYKKVSMILVIRSTSNVYMLNKGWNKNRKFALVLIIICERCFFNTDNMCWRYCQLVSCELVSCALLSFSMDYVSSNYYVDPFNINIT